MKVIYFRFSPDCHYVKGAIRGAIYIVTTKKIIHLTKIETEIVNYLLANWRIDEVKAKYPGVADKLLNYLISAGIGFFYSKPVYAEAYEPYQPFFKLDPVIEPPPEMRCVFMQLSDRCNANCLFCKNRDYYVSQGCITCLRWYQDENTSDRLDTNNVEKMLKQLTALETPLLSFSGGNPLLEWNKLIAIVRKAIEYRPSMKFSVNTNGYGFNDEIAEDAKDLNIQFNFTIFSDSYEDYKKITGDGELYNSLLNAIEMCKMHQIIYTVSVLVSPDSRQHYNKIHQFAQKLGGVFLNVSEIFPKIGTKKPLACLPIGEEAGKKFFSSFNPHEFFEAQYFSKCLKGIIAVSKNGMILPCPLWDEPIARIPEDDIFSVFQHVKHKQYWELNKTKVPTCNRCEFRFICNDCTVTDQHREKDPSIHNAVCTYRPDKGEWIS